MYFMYEECVREACAGTKSVQVDYLLEVHGRCERGEGIKSRFSWCILLPLFGIVSSL